MVLGAEQVNQVGQAGQAEQSDKSAMAQELKKIEDLRKLQSQLDTKAYDSLKWDSKRLEALKDEKGYHAKLQKDAGVRVLSDLAKDLANIGIDLTPKTGSKGTTSKLNDEMEQLLNKTSGREDKVEIKHQLTREAVKGVGGRGEEEHKEKEGKKDARQLVSSADVKETMQQYSAAYAQNALTASPQARERLDDAQDKLRKKGFSEKDIRSLERSVNRSFRSEFVSDIQDSFIQHMFSPKNTFEFVVTSRQVNNAFKQAIDAKKLTGITDDVETVKVEMDKIKETSQEEIKDFIQDAVESKLIERHVADRDVRDDLKKLVQLGSKVGFNFESFLKTWEQKKFDLGLFVLEVENAQRADTQVQIGIGEVSAGGVGQRHGYEMTKDEEKELLTNQLRAEFMKRAITGDPFAVFTFAPKIRKLKNGLIKLGLESEDFSKIEKEAKALARYRTLEMLREAFIERSTYYELSGPSYGLLSNKIKGLVSNLEKLDMKLTKEELDMIRDDANRMMHDHTIIELNSALAILESGENKAVEKKLPLMVKLIKRLREESHFVHGLGYDVDAVIFKHETDTKNVKESA